MKKFFKILLILVLALVLALGGLIGWLSATEYKPGSIEALKPLSDTAEEKLPQGAELELLSWNIGYAGLGKGSDFVMDGGEHMRAADRETVQRYLAGISETVRSGDYDLVLLQEVDVNSSRTYSIDETGTLASGDAAFALNYSCGYVPNPNTYFIDPFGKIHSGLLSCSSYAVESSERRSLPCPFSWPLRIVNLKRCLLVSYLPVEGSDARLVLVNLHLEAYPNTHPENWIPGVLEESSLPEGFSFVYDLAVPSCRLLNQPYDPADTVNTQHYVIDGLIVSPNVTVKAAETLDLGFENSDHNPVRMVFSLG